LHEASRDLLDKKLLCPLLKIEMAYEFPHEKKEINRKKESFLAIELMYLNIQQLLKVISMGIGLSNNGA
jgi:hypothetical protein